MDKDDLVQRLMVTFVGELEDHARSLERTLLALEKQPASAFLAEGSEVTVYKGRRL